MSSLYLERARNAHELSERYENEIVKILNNKPSGQKAKVWQQHEINNVLQKLTSTQQELLNIYEDKDGIMRDELTSMRGDNMFRTFYETIKNTGEYSRRFPDAVNISDIQNQMDIDEVNVQFSGEEVFGKYLDLNNFYIRYCNLPGIPYSRDQDYLQYLDKFNTFFYISENNKTSNEYIKYINDLWEYLLDFFLRIQPLVDMNEFIDTWKNEFDNKWLNGKISGWDIKSAQSRNVAPEPIRLGMFNSAQELEALGLERLKSGLEALGLKCGGTLKDRAERLWSVRGKKPHEIPDKLKKKETSSNGSPNGDIKREIAWTEWKIQAICTVMSDTVIATRKHSEKQQTRTAEEKEAEILEEEYGTLPDIEDEEEGNDDEDGPLYNPLNLPLGWDGKPIPFWLYKLHGLGTEFKCEICGNQSYWGRRAFDKHFQEWRHAHGMRCLGVPNTKHFHDITLIEDALALYSKIKDSMKTEQFLGDIEEEFEDSEGNVLNRRTYEDLARQGLL